MFSFEYKIDLNEYGRPIITPSEKTDKELDFIEHKFMALELARAIVTNTISSHEENPIKRPLEPTDLTVLVGVRKELEKICDIYATAIKDQMSLMNDVNTLISPQKYDVQVDTLDEMHKLNYNGIIYNGEIFKRHIGLRVRILSTKQIFELRDGIDNTNWIDVTAEQA
jgi:hypothetical protein